MSVFERIDHYIDPPNEKGCREWSGATNRGYPTLGSKAEKFMGSNLPHRMVYMRASGEKIPGYIPVHHACANTLCLEPGHLQAVYPHENTAEMLERKHYKARIAALESALFELSPEHVLLEVAHDHHD